MRALIKRVYVYQSINQKSVCISELWSKECMYIRVLIRRVYVYQSIDQKSVCISEHWSEECMYTRALIRRVYVHCTSIFLIHCEYSPMCLNIYIIYNGSNNSVNYCWRFGKNRKRSFEAFEIVRRHASILLSAASLAAFDTVKFYLLLNNVLNFLSTTTF